MADLPFPRTVMRGPLKGQHFETRAAYDEARAQVAVEEPADSTPGGVTVTPRKPKSANGVTKPMADGLVQVANVVLSVIPWTRRDTLDSVEQEALSLSIVETARSNKHFAHIIVQVCRVQAESQLGITVGCIVARRLAAREVIPAEVGAFSYLMLIGIAGGQMPIPSEPPSPDGQAGEVSGAETAV